MQPASATASRSPPPPDAAASQGMAAEEAELHARIALTREGAQIRAEIHRLRAQIALGSSAASISGSSGSGGSGGSSSGK